MKNYFAYDLVKELEKKVSINTNTAYIILNTCMSMDKEFFQSLFNGSDYYFRTLDESKIPVLLDSLNHEAWKQFTQFYNFYNYPFGIRDSYDQRIKYVNFSSLEKFKYYSGITQLKPFTLENALEFYDEHLILNDERIENWKQLFKDRCNYSDKFKSKMTFVSFNFGSVDYLILLIAVICAEINKDFVFSEYWKIISEPQQCKVEYEVFEGLTVEKNLNGNATIRFSKELVDLLNNG